MPLACLGSAEARHKLTPRRQRIQIKIIRIRTNVIRRPAILIDQTYARNSKVPKSGGFSRANH
jgi:hypothetical protein